MIGESSIRLGGYKKFLSPSLKMNNLPPYKESKHISLHVLNKDFPEFDSCILQISDFNAYGQITHLQEGKRQSLLRKGYERTRHEKQKSFGNKMGVNNEVLPVKKQLL